MGVLRVEGKLCSLAGCMRHLDGGSRAGACQQQHTARDIIRVAAAVPGVAEAQRRRVGAAQLLKGPLPARAGVFLEHVEH